MNLKTAFPFINHGRLRAIVYTTPRHEKIRLGNVVFDRHTYKSKPHLVLDAIARDKQALQIVGHLTSQMNRKRAQYYPYFNRSLSRGEIVQLTLFKNPDIQPSPKPSSETL
jgi:hypothetical protein